MLQLDYKTSQQTRIQFRTSELDFLLKNGLVDLGCLLLLLSIFPGVHLLCRHSFFTHVIDLELVLVQDAYHLLIVQVVLFVYLRAVHLYGQPLRLQLRWKVKPSHDSYSSYDHDLLLFAFICLALVFRHEDKDQYDMAPVHNHAHQVFVSLELKWNDLNVKLVPC